MQTEGHVGVFCGMKKCTEFNRKMSKIIQFVN